MGHAATRELLIGRWANLTNDPSLHDLPYKIELNEEGVIQMSPASNRHGMKQADIAFDLRSGLNGGRVITECAVLTRIGVRVPDVAWASDALLASEGNNSPFSKAPEICVEIRSPSNSDAEITEKVVAYLEAGAQEVWVVAEDAAVTFHGAEGVRKGSNFGLKPSVRP